MQRLLPSVLSRSTISLAVASTLAGQVPGPAAEVNVAIRNFAFSPQHIAVNVGDTVIWTNEDGIGHTSTCDAGDSVCGSPILTYNGLPYSKTFDQAGVFAYHCTPHPFMTGSLTVVGNPPSELTTTWRGHTYEVILGRTTWEEADITAKARGGHLVTITSSDEWTAIKNFVNEFQSSIPLANRSFPLGLVHEVWQTGEPFDFKDWASGFPYYVPAYGFWSYASGGSDHQWKTVYGAGFYFEFFIVEKDPLNPQIRAEWNGHTYEVVWFKDVFGRDPLPESDTWWVGHQPRDHAASLGGHILTITSFEEEEAVRQMWSRIPVTEYTILARFEVDTSTTPLTIRWETGEASTYLHELVAEVDFPTLYLNDVPMQVRPSDPQVYRDGSGFYILEKDPMTPIVTEWQGHRYEAVIGRTTWEDADAAAKANGGHLVTATSPAEWSAIKTFVNGFQSPIPLASRSFPLGLVHEVWQTGEAFVFKDWAAGFPYYVPAHGLWAYASGGNDHHWKTVYGPGFFFEFFIVEKDPPRVEYAPVTVYPAIEIEFRTTAGQKYQVQVSVDLMTWANLGEIFTAVGQTTARFIQARGVARFVRVAVVP